MKILLIGKTLGIGGTKRYTEGFVDYLKTTGKVNFDFINLKKIYEDPSPSIKKILKLFHEFPKQVNYDKYDLIHYLQGDLSLYGMLRYLKKKKHSIKLIETSHGIAKREEIYPGFKGFIFRRLWGPHSQNYTLKNLDAIICVSDFAKDLFLKEFQLDTRKLYVVYLASGLKLHNEGAKSLTNAKRNEIVFVGRFDRRKRIEKVMELARVLPDYQFNILGRITDPGYYREVLKKTPHNVSVKTNLSDAQITQNYRTARFFVSFSKWEFCPVTYLEAISLGTPVLAYCQPIKKLVENGCGFEVKTVPQCVNVIRHLEEKYDQLVCKALETSKSFSWKNTVERTLEIYERVLNQLAQ